MSNDSMPANVEALAIANNMAIQLLFQMLAMKGRLEIPYISGAVAIKAKALRERGDLEAASILETMLQGASNGEWAAMKLLVDTGSETAM